MYPIQHHPKRVLGQCTEGCENCIKGFCVIGQCNPGYYSNNKLDAQCLKCDSSCLECSGSGKNKCKSCRENFQFQKYQCIECKINNGEFFDNSDKSCKSCSQNCLTCSDQNTCTQCQDNFEVVDNKCQQKQCASSPGQYYDDESKICLNCDPNCSTCIISATKCTSCNEGYLLNTMSEECNSDCVIPTFYIDQNKCQSCDSSCQTCEGTSKNCTSCQGGYYLNTEASACIPVCPVSDGFYVSGFLCQPCHTSCGTCSGPLETDCILCASNFYKYGGNQSCRPCGDQLNYDQIIDQQNCAELNLQCQLNPSTNNYELKIICLNCQTNLVLANNNCLNSCSEVTQDYVFNQALRYCQCIPSKPYQHLLLPSNKILCTKSQLSGYYCDSNKICNQCQQTNCDICSNQLQCTKCNQGYYLWQNSCLKTCENDLGQEISKSQIECVCKEDYIFYPSKNMCVLQLQISSIKLAKDSQSNVLTIVFNRTPFPEELKTIKIQINPSKLTLKKDYKIVSQNQNDNELIYIIQVEYNIKVNEIIANYNDKRVIYQIQNAILTTEEANKLLSSSQNQINNLNSVGQSLIPKSGSAQTIVNILKNFQILCFLSNFVQLLGPLIVFKTHLPQPLYVGAILGASFIFTETPDSDLLSANTINSSNINQTPSEQQKLLQQLGLNGNIYSNLPIPHLLLMISVIICLLFLLARWVMKGKQYTITIVNLLVNQISSMHQGYITCSLYSILYSLQYTDQKYIALIQIAIHVIFLVLICVIIYKREVIYIQNHIPNFIFNLNIKARGWRSYLILSYLKKYVSIIIIYTFYQNPITCCVAIAILFFCFTGYLLYFRFFISKICNLCKIFQEFFISFTFILFTFSVKKQDELMQKEIISNDDLTSTFGFSLVVLYMLIACLIISFLIFLARTGVFIFNLVQQIRKYFYDKRNQKNLNQSLDLLISEMNNDNIQYIQLPVIKVQIDSTQSNKNNKNSDSNSVKNYLGVQLKKM